MGFDLMGQAAKSEKGEYFRNNVWWWRPLWMYVVDSCDLPDEIAEQGGWNNGYVVKHAVAMKIGIKLKHLISQGHTQEFADKYEKERKEAEDVECDICEGTGKRRWTKKTLNDVMDDVEHPLGKLMGDVKPWKEGDGEYEEKKCNGCGGKGKKRPWSTSYPFNVENVEEFAQFCIESGGFAIC